MQRVSPRLSRVAALVLVGVFVAEAVLPIADAGYKTFGEVVDPSASAADKDVTHLLLVTLAAGAEVMFDDVDTDGNVDTNEGVYIDVGLSSPGAIGPTDIRIRSSTGASGTKGEQVKSTDADCCGTPLSAAPGGWAFSDDFPVAVGTPATCVADPAAITCPDGLLN
ncbi:MAG: hypothetical protein LC624_08215, partial [Halobacteriales archaeon]|nr:hypothetical protein [Halobacteriales archaeon]